MTRSLAHRHYFWSCWCAVNPEIFGYRGKVFMEQGYFMEALMDFSVAIMLEKNAPNENKQNAAQGEGKEKKDLHLHLH